MIPMTSAREIETYMESLRNDGQRRVLMSFFKTGKGEYGEGDEFLGLRVPQTRQIVKMAAGTDLSEIPLLLNSKWHEVRLCGLLLLVDMFQAAAKRRLTDDEEAIRQRDSIVELYLRHSQQANNWDLVDLSAPKILGHWLLLPTNMTAESHSSGDERMLKQDIVDRLADSTNLWQQRISMVCTWKTTQQGDASWCLRYAEKHLHHTHDLMQKAVGWMLREMGKRVSTDLLRNFLQQHVATMPRTTLRYAIEKLSEEERRHWMSA